MNESKVNNRLIVQSKYSAGGGYTLTLKMKLLYHLIDHMNLRRFLWKSKSQNPINLIQKMRVFCYITFSKYIFKTLKEDITIT